MTRDEFFAKYPKPWTFEETDPSGTGALKDANGQILAWLGADLDWNDEEHDDTRRRPLMNVDEPELDGDREIFLTLLEEAFQ